MATPRILLLSRRMLENADDYPTLLTYLAITPVVMAIAQSDRDRDAALSTTEQIATFTGVTAIVADFPGCMAVNDDGSIEPIVTPDPAQPYQEEPLIKLVQ